MLGNLNNKIVKIKFNKSGWRKIRKIKMNLFIVSKMHKSKESTNFHHPMVKRETQSLFKH